MERDTELALVERLRQGDADAFDEVYAAFNVRLFTFLVRLSRRRDVAEDLLEETWLRFVARARDLSADTCLTAWLYTVARNLHASWCRNRALHEERISDLTPSWPAAAPGETHFETTARTETKRRVEMALARLTLRDREVLLLVAVDELTPSVACPG